jgi:diguanylate cyclase (GGDEF)-like protein
MVLSVLILAGAMTATHYVAGTTERNAKAVALRNSAVRTSYEVRTAIQQAEFALNSMLLNPRLGQSEDIERYLASARARLDALRRHSGTTDAGLTPKIDALSSALEAMHGQFRQLIELRRDPEWVYPALPYIEGTTLRGNIDFETQARLAITELDGVPASPESYELYRRLAEIRDLWRRMMLNYRAIMIRYAGLHDTDPGDQELNVEQLNAGVRVQLESLLNRLGPDTSQFIIQDAAHEMLKVAADWQSAFENVKALRRSKNWRADVEYFESRIRPALLNVFSVLDELESDLGAWTDASVRELERAANRSLVAMWGLAGLGLVFVVLAYVLFERVVLRPVERVADALTVTAKGANEPPLDESGVREVRRLVSAFGDMHRQVQLRQTALEHQALHDALTGLPNRSLLGDRLRHALQSAARANQRVGLLLLDLDRFKEINDTLGHQVGDVLLQQVSARLLGLVRQSDTVARLGGDEFAVVVADANEAQLAALAARINSALDQKFEVNRQGLYVGVSIGIAVYPDHGRDAAALIRQADVAMYVAKRTNKGFVFYDERQDEHSRDQLALVADLRTAIATDQLELHYQPKVDVQKGRVIGMEALLRWNHLEQGPISPDRVARLAEQTGMIASLTAWVIRRALAESRSLVAARPGLHVAINVSPWNLQDPDFPAQVHALLEEAGAHAAVLTFEITESAVMADPLGAKVILDALTETGVKFAVDDFGTGFSSLGYLKRLPVSELKIDKSFVIDMLNDANDAAIVRSTIELGHSLGLRVAAEGVENDETWTRLREQRCDTAQGMFFGAPMPMPRLLAWIDEQESGAKLIRS